MKTLPVLYFVCIYKYEYVYFSIIWITTNICVVTDSLARSCVLFLVCLLNDLCVILSSVKAGMSSEWTRFSPLVPLAVIGLRSGTQKHSWLNPQVNKLQTGIQRTHRVALYL